MMFGKHFLLTLLVGHSFNFASAHIVTSVHTDPTFSSCVKSLTNMVETALCPTHEQIEPNSMEQVYSPAVDPLETESRSWQFRNNIKICCSRPCTITELMAIC